jgi:hypothetical protein
MTKKQFKRLKREVEQVVAKKHEDRVWIPLQLLIDLLRAAEEGTEEK